MKVSIITFAFAVIYSTSSAVNGQDECTLASADIPKEWVDMTDSCIKAMRDQVDIELTAALTYLNLGAHFAKDTVNRPGFSKFFFNHANEERGHAIEIIKYLLMRGELTKDVKDLIHKAQVAPNYYADVNGVTALKEALKLETQVTSKITHIIKTCEGDAKKNDYHLVDYLTGVFLDEQLKGQRELAGLVSTLGRMMIDHGALGEFLFDKKLLKGEAV